MFGILGVASSLAVASISGALAAGSASSSSISGVAVSSTSNSGIAGKSWANIGAEEFAGLPAGTLIVDCYPDVKQLPPGGLASRSPGFFAEHPGFHFLIDGRCALDPSATPIPIRSDSLDPHVP